MLISELSWAEQKGVLPEAELKICLSFEIDGKTGP